MSAPPEFRRELIRHANRDGFNSTEVEALLEYSDFAFHLVITDGEYDVPTTEDAVTALIEVWKESFDEEP